MSRIALPPLRVFALASLVMTGQSACRHSMDLLRERAAKDFECPRHMLRLEKVRRNVWSAEGCGQSSLYAIKGRRPDRNWVREYAYETPSRQRELPSLPPSPPIMHAVVDTTRGPQGPLIVARIQPRAQDSVIIQLRGTPKTSPEAATFILNIRNTSGSLEGCSLRLVADGTLVPLTDAGEHKVVGSSQKLSIEIPLETLSSLSKAERLIGQACEVRFECTTQNIAAMGSFVVHFREELALLRADDHPASAQPTPNVP